MPTKAGVAQLQEAAAEAAELLEMLGQRLPDEEASARFLSHAHALRQGIEAAGKKSFDDILTEAKEVAAKGPREQLPDPKPRWEKTRDKRRWERAEVEGELVDLWKEVENKW